MNNKLQSLYNSNLSGQKQRTALCRAIVRDPVLLSLDEATSALDAQTEQLVQDALEKHMEQRKPNKGGLLLVAHRLSTVRNADAIVVLSKGVVAEMGTYEDLLSRKHSIFRDLVSRQIQQSDSTAEALKSVDGLSSTPEEEEESSLI
jgi:ABC-type multidrug transport system fused ATPase/permease subunit